MTFPLISPVRGPVAHGVSSVVIGSGYFAVRRATKVNIFSLGGSLLARAALNCCLKEGLDCSITTDGSQQMKLAVKLALFEFCCDLLPKC
jgi:hypothetical protein